MRAWSRWARVAGVGWLVAAAVLLTVPSLSAWLVFVAAYAVTGGYLLARPSRQALVVALALAVVVMALALLVLVFLILAGTSATIRINQGLFAFVPAAVLTAVAYILARGHGVLERHAGKSEPLVSN